MKIMIATDAWLPQINGVVTTLSRVKHYLEMNSGQRVEVVEPGRFRNVPLPGYNEIRLAVDVAWKFKSIFEAIQPDAIHIATEGPIGLSARMYCVRYSIPFTTAVHTRFPEYINARIGLPVQWGYSMMRWFHKPAVATLVTTQTIRVELEEKGFKNLVVWGRGVDTELFSPRALPDRPPPLRRLLYVGRVAVEKNLEAFLALNVLGIKIVVGDGPARNKLSAKYPDVEWRGYLHGEDLADEYASADVFVFPSKTDTFGIVLLEALACGVPVAAYPVAGPKDIVQDGITGSLHPDLAIAIENCRSIYRADCRRYAELQSWNNVGRSFESGLQVISRDQEGE